MKKTIVTLFIISLFFFIGCNFIQNNEKLADNIGSLTVKFLLNDLDITRSVISDFSQVVNGKVFLQQDSVIKYQADLIIDTVNKTGEGTISNIIIGTYDVILELYDSALEVIYSGTDIVIINSDSTSSSIITLSKNSAILSITGNWIEDINDLATGSIYLLKNSIVKYAGNLSIDTINKTITGGINNIQPGSYDIYIEIKDTAEMICFTANQAMVIHKGSNNIALTLIVKTGNIEINITGDVSAPTITVAPAVSIAGQDVIITWSTNENATSNICYSTTSGFNYQTSTNWAPIGQDLTADNMNHSITIQGLVLDQSYYYVVVTVDAAGNMIVSDEMNFIVVEIPTPTPTIELLQMLPIEGGTFNNGVSDITLDSFNMSKYEITQGQYESVIDINPSWFTGDINKPVEQITWYDAIEFCNRLSILESKIPCYTYLGYGSDTSGWPGGWKVAEPNNNIMCDFNIDGYRLPTEAEWEFAARGGILTHNYIYSGSNIVYDVAWYDSNSESTTHVVGTKSANELALYDMSGNVWELCWDWYGAYQSGAQTNPTGATSGTYHSLRGGSWGNIASYTSTDFRNVCSPVNTNYTVGFRVVRK